MVFCPPQPTAVLVISLFPLLPQNTSLLTHLAQSHVSECPSLHSLFLGSKFQKHTSYLNSLSPYACMLLYSLLHSTISPTRNSSQIPKSLQSPIAFLVHPTNCLSPLIFCLFHKGHWCIFYNMRWHSVSTWISYELNIKEAKDSWPSRCVVQNWWCY